MKSSSSLFTYLLILLLIAFLTNVQNLNAQETNWPQFRGPKSSGHADKNCNPPVEFGTDNNLLWKVELPEGHSSPCIWGNNIFLTGFIKDKSELQTICVDRNSGNIKWRQSVLPDSIQKYHSISNAAVATPTTDGERVYVYFGSYGLLCYNFKGNLVWEKQMQITNIKYGASSSPIIAGDKIIISFDFHENGYIQALDKVTGEEVWKVVLPNVYKNHYNTTSYSTPIVMKDQVVIHRVEEISGYSIRNGSRLWWLPTPTSGISTPVFSQNTLYIGTWQPFGERTSVGDLPDFDTMVTKNDKNGNKLITKDEIPDKMLVFGRPGMDDQSMYVKKSFGFFDKNKDKAIDKGEWEKTCEWIVSFYGESGLMALQPSGTGEIPISQILWKILGKVPEVPSPVFCKNCVYMIKNGGDITCVDAVNGKVFYCERLGASGAYIASPVVASGNIYIPSGNGVVTVIKAGNKLEILAQNDLDEKIYASPAIIENVIYVRTAGNLYAFEE